MPNDKIRSVFNIVSQAQSHALNAARPGIAAEMVDAAADELFSGNGYGPGYKYLTHSFGHGIGMDGHEWFYLVCMCGGGASVNYLRTKCSATNPPFT